MNNIILIGMPASGKSTIGVVLAKITGKDFVDTDLTIQHAEGRPLQQIIDEEGTERFKEIEEKVIMGFDESDCVVATGGSVGCCDSAMEHLRKKGVVVYLQVSLEGILERLTNLETRGVTLKPGQTISDLYAERIPFYEKNSDITFQAEGMDIWEAAEALAREIKVFAR